jgi:hypothetical protein
MDNVQNSDSYTRMGEWYKSYKSTDPTLCGLKHQNVNNTHTDTRVTRHSLVLQTFAHGFLRDKAQKGDNILI